MRRSSRASRMGRLPPAGSESLIPKLVQKAMGLVAWLALAIFVVVSLPFGSLWFDWVHSILNSQGGGIAYSSLEIPMLAFPLIAWAGRERDMTR